MFIDRVFITRGCSLDKLIAYSLGSELNYHCRCLLSLLLLLVQSKNVPTERNYDAISGKTGHCYHNTSALFRL